MLNGAGVGITCTLCTDTSLEAIEIIRIYGLRFKIEHSFKRVARLILSFAYQYRKPFCGHAPADSVKGRRLLLDTTTVEDKDLDQSRLPRNGALTSAPPLTCSLMKISETAIASACGLRHGGVFIILFAWQTL